MIAVIYTGCLRTIKTTLPHFIKNILWNKNHHVFAILQNDGPADNAVVGDYLANQMGDHLKHIEWIEPYSLDSYKYQLINDMPIDVMIKDYLYTSGSVVEYYQAYLAVGAIEKYEERENMRYEYIIRIRCDVVFTRPLDVVSRINDDDNINQRMNSLLGGVSRGGSALFEEHRPDPIPDLAKYIAEGNYVITMRKNVVYFTNRKHLDFIKTIALNYGQYITPHFAWWDSESQFQAVCNLYGLTVYDSGLDIECKSLYEYDHTDYFEDDECKVLKKTDALFFICRYETTTDDVAHPVSS
jgi:hypothetical protein